jgi:acyl-CoA reductase-like NAD-dependent aldehyde dehydrogenase
MFADRGEAEAPRPVGAARRASGGRRGRALCSRVLLELTERFEARAPELALILTREKGKPWRLRSQSGRLPPNASR